MGCPLFVEGQRRGIWHSWRTGGQCPLSKDYRFSLRALSNRQKGILQNIVAVDQAYCVAEKSMTDKIFLLTEGFLQVGPLITQCWGLLVLVRFFFNGSISCTVFGENWDGLSWSILVQWGIRQGCPISAQLYSLAIISLLCTLRGQLGGVTFPESCSLDHPLIVSAYADDINIFIARKEDVQCLQYTLLLYEKASTSTERYERKKLGSEGESVCKGT